MRCILCITVIVFYSCANANISDCPVGKAIDYPIDSLQQYNDYEYINDTNFKTIYCLDASCPPCIEELYKLNLYIDKLNTDNNTYVVILSGKDSEFTQSHVNDIGSFNFPILYDPLNKFFKDNDLGILKLRNHNCILVSPDNIIKNCGNPYLSRKVERENKRIIKRHFKKIKE
ncbi:MAG: hypothetical protein U5K32_11790 [Bacteroidales bacterium]|nr:hypothetical protein [Bacteroidales bacterium]